MKGRSLINGLPATAPVSELDIFRAIEEDIGRIAEAAISVFEHTPPELIGDIYESGIILTGGGSLIKGLDTYIAAQTGVSCHAAQDPLGCVARGTHMVFKIHDQLRNGFERISVFKK